MSDAQPALEYTDDRASSLLRPPPVPRWWVRWTIRLLVWAVFAVVCALAGIINFVLCQSPAKLSPVSPKPWVNLCALPYETQCLFDGDHESSLQMTRGMYGPYKILHAIGSAYHLQWFVEIETRRGMALNRSAVTSLEKPYQAALEDLAGSGHAGWWLVRDEIGEMQFRGQITQSRYDQLVRHLGQIEEAKGYGF